MNNCEWTKERTDTFIDGELGEEATTVDAHLAECSDCRNFIADRRMLRHRVRSAADAVDVPGDLSFKVVARMEGARRWPVALMATAAVLTLAFAAVWKVRTGYPETEATMWPRISAAATPILRVGLRDHIHCALFRKLPANASIGQLAARLGPQLGELARVLEQSVPKGMRVVDAHKCRADGREYIHLIARDESRRLSLVITARGDTESIREVFSGSVEELRVGAFETKSYLVYVVSNASEDDNSGALRAAAPGVRRILDSAI